MRARKFDHLDQLFLEACQRPSLIGSGVASVRRKLPRSICHAFREQPRERCASMTENSAISALGLTSGRPDTVRQQVGGSPACPEPKIVADWALMHTHIFSCFALRAFSDSLAERGLIRERSAE